MTTLIKNPINFVADIGGTNIRLAQLNQDEQLDHIESYQCRDFDSLAAVIKQYLSEKNITDKTLNACLAIACPVENDQVFMTNMSWSFSKKALKAELKLNNLWLINDYTAIAHAIPQLTSKQKMQVGGGNAIAKKPIAVCGPGTGLGVANLVNVNNHWVCLSGEGGHTDFAPVNLEQVAILQFLFTKYHHVSYEQLLSGLGLEQIYQAIIQNNQLDECKLTAAEISQKAIDGSCKYCLLALEHFCKILGSFAGNLALTGGSFGGVYIAGGIVPRFIDFFKESGFRKCFEQKGRFSDYNQNIPTFVITESQPGMLGAAAYLCQQLLILKSIT
ncbi:MAG: glucokinase [Gammaproteobacteria bacterium]|nr:MAG: glucokinase [Gammaproteobacteria bacterium]